MPTVSHTSVHCFSKCLVSHILIQNFQLAISWRDKEDTGRYLQIQVSRRSGINQTTTDAAGSPLQLHYATQLLCTSQSYVRSVWSYSVHFWAVSSRWSLAEGNFYCPCWALTAILDLHPHAWNNPYWLPVFIVCCEGQHISHYDDTINYYGSFMRPPINWQG